MNSDQEQQQKPFGIINACCGVFADKTLGVLITLSPGSLTTDLEGNPVPGICMETWQARRFAYVLLQLAEEMDARMRLGLVT